VSTHRVHAGYVGIPSFFQCPVVEADAIRNGMAVVTGVPIDQGIVFGKPGTRFGPRAMRESSTSSRAFFAASPEHTQVDIDTNVALRVKDAPSLVDVGDVDIDPTDIMKTTDAVVRAVADVTRRGGMPVVLGGDHYIAYPSFEGFVRGMAERGSNPRVATCISTRTRASATSTWGADGTTTAPRSGASARARRSPTGTWRGSA
jgi:arginase family enzyme